MEANIPVNYIKNIYPQYSYLITETLEKSNEQMFEIRMKGTDLKYDMNDS